MSTKTLAIALASSTLAAAVAAPAFAQSQPTYSFNIPATNLDDALKTVSRQTGREIIYPEDAVTGIRSRRLAARLPADDAVRQLLEGTNLQAEFRAEAIVIRRRDRSSPATTVVPAEPIVVTGTRIRGSSTVSTTTIGREQARAEGLNDLGAVIRSLPQNYSGGQNPGVGSGPPGSEDVNSSSALNLRGLGPDATLTLVNGHRMAYDAAAQGIDIAAIPLIAIDRLEVLTDGSSALYGSDAVAGVANVILRAPFSGGEARARIAIPTAGGGIQDQYSVLAGTTWDGGGMIAALDYLHADPIRGGDRSFTSTLNPLTTVMPGQTQYSGVLAGRHDLSDRLSFSIDGHFSSRTSSISTPLFSPGDLNIDGTVSDRKVESYSVAPSLTWDIAEWQFKLGGVHGSSLSTLPSLSRSGGQDFVRAFATYRNTIDSAELGAEGPVIDLPGGTARVALGAGWRGVELDGFVRSVIFGTPQIVLDIVERDDVKFAYAEAAVPLVGESNVLPGVRVLSLSGALRYEHYSGLDGVTVPKVAARYDPIRALSFRASWGKSFKAPTLLQKGQLPRGILIPASIFRPRPATGSTVIFLSAGNDDLQPERAETWTVGAVLTPFPNRDLRIEAMYSNLNYRDRVAAPILSVVSVFGNPVYGTFVSVPTGAEAAALAASLPLGLINQTGAPFDPASVGAVIDNRLQNIASFRVETVDVAIHAATRSNRLGELSFDGSVSYIESDQQIGPSQPRILRAGTIYDPPTWRGRASLGWRRGELALTGVFSHIGGTLDNRFEPNGRIGSFNTVDATAIWSPANRNGLLSGTAFTLSVLNVFEEKPDTFAVTDAVTPPFDATNYTSVGRVISLSIAKRW